LIPPLALARVSSRKRWMRRRNLQMISTQQSSGKRIAILVENGFEQEELTEPKRALEQAGMQAVIVCPAHGKVKAWQHDHCGEEFDVNVPMADAREADFDGLLLPGGVMKTDRS
jgi:protease I